MVTSVTRIYANTWEAQTGAILTPADGEGCVFQDPVVELSGRKTKRSVSGPDSLPLCLLSVSTSSSVTHVFTVIQTFIQTYCNHAMSGDRKWKHRLFAYATVHFIFLRAVFQAVLCSLSQLIKWTPRIWWIIETTITYKCCLKVSQMKILMKRPCDIHLFINFHLEWHYISQ